MKAIRTIWLIGTGLLLIGAVVREVLMTGPFRGMETVVVFGIVNVILGGVEIKEILWEEREKRTRPRTWT